MRFTNIGLIIILLTLHTLNAKAQLTVATNADALQLARRIVGPGISILNPTLKGADVSSGFFTDKTNTIGIDSGIVLTSGRAASEGTFKGINGTAVLPRATYTFPTSISAYNGDADLYAFSKKPTFDATILEFDFIPQGDSINVSFVFGSEEYQGVGNDAGYICTNYNDVFAFLIEGPGFNGKQNIALVPGTNIPVAINSINNGIPNLVPLDSCLSMGPGSPFTAYYIDNRNGGVVSYNGFTTVLVAKAKVTPCQTYHIRLGVADGGDHTYDSGVFIAASSFKSNIMTLSPAGGFSVNSEHVIVEGCKSATITLEREAAYSANPATAVLAFSGTADYGVDYYPIPLSVNFAAGETQKTLTIIPTQDGTIEPNETLKILLFTGSCTASPTDSISFLIKDTIVFNSAVDTFLCSAFPLVLEAKIDNGSTNTWQWSTGEKTRTIVAKNPGTYNVTHTFNGSCFNKEEFIVGDGDPVINLGGNQVICGDASITLNAFNAGAIYTWSTSATSSSITVKQSGFYSVKVTKANGCIKTASVNITVKPSPKADLGDDIEICPGDKVTLNASYPNASYLWSTGSTTDSIVVNTIGEYWIKSIINGCSDEDTIYISLKRVPVVNAGADQTILPGGAAMLSTPSASVNASYLWMPPTFLNDNRRPNPLSYATADQLYTITVTSIDGCIATDSIKVFVRGKLMIPGAFSPNGDGINDVWNVPLLHTLLNARIEIFNRAGQMIFNSVGYQQPFDGKINGKPVPVGTYYYLIDPNDGINGRRSGTLTILR